jgi:hypothetical protein
VIGADAFRQRVGESALEITVEVETANTVPVPSECQPSPGGPVSSSTRFLCRTTKISHGYEPASGPSAPNNDNASISQQRSWRNTREATSAEPPGNAQFHLGRYGTELIAVTDPHGRGLKWLKTR